MKKVARDQLLIWDDLKSKSLIRFWNDTGFFSCLLTATINEEGEKMLPLGIASVRRLVYYDAHDLLLPLRASFCLVISSARPQQRLDYFQKKNDSPLQNLALSRTISLKAYAAQPHS